MKEEFQRQLEWLEQQRKTALESTLLTKKDLGIGANTCSPGR